MIYVYSHLQDNIYSVSIKYEVNIHIYHNGRSDRSTGTPGPAAPRSASHGHPIPISCSCLFLTLSFFSFFLSSLFSRVRSPYFDFLLSIVYHGRNLRDWHSSISELFFTLWTFETLIYCNKDELLLWMTRKKEVSVRYENIYIYMHKIISE